MFSCEEKKKVVLAIYGEFRLKSYRWCKYLFFDSYQDTIFFRNVCKHIHEREILNKFDKLPWWTWNEFVAPCSIMRNLKFYLTFRQISFTQQLESTAVFYWRSIDIDTCIIFNYSYRLSIYENCWCERDLSKSSIIG